MRACSLSPPFPSLTCQPTEGSMPNQPLSPARSTRYSRQPCSCSNMKRARLSPPCPKTCVPLQMGVQAQRVPRPHCAAGACFIPNPSPSPTSISAFTRLPVSSVMFRVWSRMDWIQGKTRCRPCTACRQPTQRRAQQLKHRWCATQCELSTAPALLLNRSLPVASLAGHALDPAPQQTHASPPTNAPRSPEN